jgi:hypothetical protein
LRVFKLKLFSKFAKEEGITDQSLLEAIERAEKGLIYADLGGCLIKQRVARTNQGQSGGYRVLIAYKQGDKAFFLYGFAKNERDNIKPQVVQTYRDIGFTWFEKNLTRLGEAVAQKQLEEIEDV